MSELDELFPRPTDPGFSGVLIGKVTKATHNPDEAWVSIPSLSDDFEFGPAPYPYPFKHHHTQPLHHHTQPPHTHTGPLHHHLQFDGVNNTGDAGNGATGAAGAENTGDAGADDTSDPVIAGTGSPPKGTKCAVIFEDGDVDKPYVLCFYGWPA